MKPEKPKSSSTTSPSLADRVQASNNRLDAVMGAMHTTTARRGPLPVDDVVVNGDTLVVPETNVVHSTAPVHVDPAPVDPAVVEPGDHPHHRLSAKAKGDLQERYDRAYAAALQGFCANSMASEPAVQAAYIAESAVSRDLDIHPDLRAK